jgi:type IV pilus assembly protein PilB
VGAVDVLAAEASDVVFCPLSAAEGLIAAAGERLGCQLLVSGEPGIDVSRAEKVGARGFVGSPVDIDMLVHGLRRLMRA